LTFSGFGVGYGLQVMARYVEPLVGHLKAFLKHRKFLKGSKDEVDAAAKKEKARRPGTFPYFLSVNFEHMGMLTLTYVTNQNPHHEYILVSHKVSVKRVFFSLLMC
jgi:transcription elongation factor SPT6